MRYRGLLRVPVAVLAVLAVAALAGCGRSLPRNTESVPAGGDTTGGFGEAGGLGGAVEVAGWKGGIGLARAAAKGFRSEEPDVRVGVTPSDTAAAVSAVCAGELSIALAERLPLTAEQGACAGPKAGRAVALEVARRGRTPVVLVTTRERLAASFETESFLTYVVDNGEQLARRAGLTPLTPSELDETQSTFDAALAELG